MSYDDMWAKTLLETTEMEVGGVCFVEWPCLLDFSWVVNLLLNIWGFLLQEYDARSSGSSSPDSIGSVETSISSHFGGMNYPSLFSSKPSTYHIFIQYKKYLKSLLTFTRDIAHTLKP